MKRNDFINKLFGLENKVAILTGSAGLMGTRFAHVLSAAGANVVLVDINERENTRLKVELTRKYHKEPLLFTLDIANQMDIKRLVKEVVAKYKKIDILINNALAVPNDHPLRDAPFEQYPLDLWNKMIINNLTGLFLCCQEIGKVMVKQNRGVIVNISSIYGITGPDQRIYGKSRLNSPAYYSLSKGGMVNLTRYLAAYWNRKNIRVNTLTLGGVYDKVLHEKNKEFVKNYSEKTMVGRMADKEDYDGALLFLASDASSYVTGANLIVDGGWTAW